MSRRFLSVRPTWWGSWTGMDRKECYRLKHPLSKISIAMPLRYDTFHLSLAPLTSQTQDTYYGTTDTKYHLRPRPHNFKLSTKNRSNTECDFITGWFLKTFFDLMLLHCYFMYWHSFYTCVVFYFITCLASCNYVAVCQPLSKSYLSWWFVSPRGQRDDMPPPITTHGALNAA